MDATDWRCFPVGGKWKVQVSACLALVTLTLGPRAQALPTEPLIVGVVESRPDFDWKGEQEHVRLAFRYQYGAWATVCENKPSTRRNEGCALDGDATRSWSVGFNGRLLGTLQTRGWRDSNRYMFTGALNIVTAQVPSVEEGAGQFEFWDGVATRRPLLAFNWESPKQGKRVWTHALADERDLEVAWPAFRAVVPTIPNCKFDDYGKPLGSDRPSEKADMVAFDRVALLGGAVLLGVRAKGGEECAELGGFGSDVWVMKPARGAAFALEGYGAEGWAHSLRLVDAGDFAGAGSIQAVFAYGGYNEDGYVLYYDGFRRSLRFSWGYH